MYSWSLDHLHLEILVGSKNVKTFCSAISVSCSSHKEGRLSVTKRLSFFPGPVLVKPRTTVSISRNMLSGVHIRKQSVAERPKGEQQKQVCEIAGSLPLRCGQAQPI